MHLDVIAKRLWRRELSHHQQLLRVSRDTGARELHMGRLQRRGLRSHVVQQNGYRDT